MSDEEKKAIKGLEWSQQQMRLGNLPDYDQGHYADIRIILNLIKKQSKEIEELKKENKEIRDWKYVIDSPIDLDKLKELDLIKIKGKEYISKSIYNELEKDKKALVNNYSNVLGNFISVDKIKAKIEVLKEDIQYSANPLSIDNSKFGIKVLQSLLEKE